MAFLNTLNRWLCCLVCVGALSLSAEPPGPVSPETSTQAKPSTPNAALEAARAKMVAERDKLIQARKAREGIAPQPSLENQNSIAVESHSGFFKDWYQQSRYFYPTAAIVAVEGAGVYSYWLYLRKLKVYWLPRLEAIETLSSAIKPQLLAFTEAEEAFRVSLVKNWADLGEDGRAALKSTLDPSFLEKLKGDLSRLESSSLTKLEQEALKKAGSVEAAFHKLTLATRELVGEIRAKIPSIESAINGKFFAEGSKQAAEALNLRQYFARDLRAIEQLDAALNRPGSIDLVLKAKNLQLTSFAKLEQFIAASLQGLDPVEDKTSQAIREKTRELRLALDKVDPAKDPAQFKDLKAKVDSLQDEVTRMSSRESQNAASLERIKTRFENLKQAMAEFTRKQNHLRSLLSAQLERTSFSQRSFSNVGLPSDFIESELAAMRSEASGSVAVSAAVVEAAEADLVKASNKLSLAISAATDTPNLTSVGIYADKEHLAAASQAKRELRGLSQTSKLAQTVKTAEHSFIRGTVSNLEANAAAFRAEAEAKLASTKNLRPSLRFWKKRSWIPNLGVVALLGIPTLDYLSRRMEAMRAESHSVSINTAKLLSERGLGAPDSKDYAGERLQYGAFFQAWQEHPALGKAGVLWPFSEPGPSNSLVARTEDLNPDLLTVFMPSLGLAREELSAELDAEVAAPEKPEVALSYDERLYRKVWTSLIDYARQSDANARLRLMRWEKRGIFEGPRKPGEAPAEDVEDIIQDLAFTVAQAPVEPIRVKEVVKEAPKAGETAPPEGAEAEAENSLLDPISPALEMIPMDFPDLGALPAEGGEVPGVQSMEPPAVEGAPVEEKPVVVPDPSTLPFRGPRSEPPPKPKEP